MGFPSVRYGGEMFRASLVPTLILFSFSCQEIPTPPVVGQSENQLTALLQPTRTLRRVSLALTGKTPTVSALDQVLDAGLNIEQFVDATLASNEFYSEMLDFGHDWIRNSAYLNGGKNEGIWRGDERATISRCGEGTVHQGAWRATHYVNGGDPEDTTYPDGGVRVICNNPSAVVRMIEPWWRTGTQVPVLGTTGGNVVREGNVDCGKPFWTIYQNPLLGTACSCGPNLRFCTPLYNYDYDRAGAPLAQFADPTMAPLSRTGSGHSSDDDEKSAARQVYDEPARLLAHLAHYDLPLSNLVTGDISVGPVQLQSVYMRFARQHPRFGNKPDGGPGFSDDNDAWFRPAQLTGRADPLHPTPGDVYAWREFTPSVVNPLFLADRNYRFDPRTADAGVEPLGVSTAGVLTMFGPNSSWPRERVRAARWLETFACVDFIPPPPEVPFNEYVRDPAREGTCQHCHQKIDPAAVFLKRHNFRVGSGNFPVWAGFGDGHWNSIALWEDPRPRWELAFIPDTLLTSATPAQFAANPESRFIDFLPPGVQLFGQAGDGTAGPLGLGKILVSSGAFDRCATLKLYQRFVGRKLDVATEKAYIDSLTAQFIASGRRVKPFVRKLMLSPEIQEGL
jgi:hypothetical protein